MLKYSFRVLEFSNHKKNLLIDFEDSTYDLLSQFIETDVVCFKNIIDQAFYDVLIKNENRELSLNVCHIYIDKNQAYLESLYDETSCSVNSYELFNLIKKYFQELKKLKAYES